MSIVPGRSPSGVRVAGDEYQHLVAWNETLLAVRPGSDAHSVTVEASDVGNVDDVVVAYRAAPAKYLQVKHAVDARTPVGTMYLTTPSGKRSLLQRFYASWNALMQDDKRPDMRLVTDRETDPADDAMRCLDRHSECLVPDIGRPEARAVREAWAYHLQIDPDELITFLGDLRLMTGRPFSAEVERCETLLWALGMNTGQTARDSAIGFVRDWVQKRERTIDVGALRDAAYDRVGRYADPGALFVVEGIDDDTHPEDADVLVRFVENYVGDDPNLRRAFHNPQDWDAVAQQIEAAAQDLRNRDIHRVIVRGAMRLPTWFLVGAALRHVRGFTVAALQHGDIWASDVAGSSAGLIETRLTERTGGTDLAVAVGIAADPTIGVERFVEEQGINVGRVAVVVPRGGLGPEAIPDGPAAATMAVTIRDELRRLLDHSAADHIHLFLAAPGGLALLLGHRWNALRPTVVYEHLGAGRGYERVWEVPS